MPNIPVSNQGVTPKGRFAPANHNDLGRLSGARRAPFASFSSFVRFVVGFFRSSGGALLTRAGALQPSPAWVPAFAGMSGVGGRVRLPGPDKGGRVAWLETTRRQDDLVFFLID